MAALDENLSVFEQNHIIEWRYGIGIANQYLLYHPQILSQLKFRLSQLSKTAVDAGGGGNCIFGAVSQQLYGNPKNHFYVDSDGIEYLVNHPEQFIEHS